MFHNLNFMDVLTIDLGNNNDRFEFKDNFES